MSVANRIGNELPNGRERGENKRVPSDQRRPVRRNRGLPLALAICIGGMNAKGLQIGLLSGTAVLVGCSGQEATDVQTRSEHPLRQLRSAMRRQLWEDAWQYSDRVLAAHPDDAKAIANVAFVAQQLGKTDQVARLLAMVCRVESYQNDARVRQAAIAMVANGELYDAIDLLDHSLQKFPSRHETRRWLFELYLNSGNSITAQSHGRALVRERHFDAKLLLLLDAEEQLIKESESVKQMILRNPEDKRPLLRRAKRLYQEEQYDEANEVLSQIVGLHPEFVPAQVLIGRTLAASGQWDALDRWERNQVSAQANELADYWLAKADAANANNSPKAAMKFYWKSGQANPSLSEPWEKLLQLMRDQDVEDPKLIASVAERAEQIRSLYSAKDRFDKLGGISREIAIQIAEILIQLGRIWEAEAWTSLATTLPPDETVKVDIVRNRIIRQLDAQTPWQVTAGHRELQPELPQSLR